MPRIPFNRPYQAKATVDHLQRALADGPTAGDGPFTREATAILTELLGVPAALLTTSCTHALELAALLLDLRPGDEVVMPSFTFVSTANAVALRGAVPVFVDCRPDTLNIDERLAEAAITDRTRAMFVVHYAGVGCAMDKIMAIAAEHGLPVVEDNAHGLGATYRGRALGTFGALATQSFHDTKNVQCGEGGALLMSDQRFLARAEIIREKGTNRGQFFRGMVDKYRWVDIGSSYLPSDLLAAVLVAQLEEFDDIQARRHAVWSAYHTELAAWADAAGVAQPVVPGDCRPPAHLYHLLLPHLADRQRFIAHLADRGIQATFHYQPLHAAPAGRRFGRSAPGGCPVTEDVADRLVRLPLYADLTAAEVERVVTAVREFATS
jgi:dTDP-4-amino-4,6-dideoxygalactose transaminase